MEKILKVKDIQEHLGIGKNRAYELVRLNGFPKIKIGNTYFIPEDKYNIWINQHLKNKIIL